MTSLHQFSPTLIRHPGQAQRRSGNQGQAATHLFYVDTSNDLVCNPGSRLKAGMTSVGTCLSRRVAERGLQRAVFHDR